ncbi:hypothetical protein VA603_01525, partial [Stenotrophomonas sp. MH1]
GLPVAIEPAFIHRRRAKQRRINAPNGPGCSRLWIKMRSSDEGCLLIHSNLGISGFAGLRYAS